MSWVRIALALSLLVAGCGSYLYPRFEKGMWSSYIRLQDVRLGMSRVEVEGIMGPPQTREEGDYRGGEYVVYFYQTHTMDSEGGNTVRGGYTPLVFQNDRLVGMGKRFYLTAMDRPILEEPPKDTLPWSRTR
jgi:hypothetical protein